MHDIQLLLVVQQGTGTEDTIRENSHNTNVIQAQLQNTRHKAIEIFNKSVHDFINECHEAAKHQCRQAPRQSEHQRKRVERCIQTSLTAD